MIFLRTWSDGTDRWENQEEELQTAEGLFLWSSSRHVPKLRSSTAGKFDLVVVGGRSSSVTLFLYFCLFTRVNLQYNKYVVESVHCLRTVPGLYTQYTIAVRVKITAVEFVILWFRLFAFLTFWHFDIFNTFAQQRWIYTVKIFFCIKHFATCWMFYELDQRNCLWRVVLLSKAFWQQLKNLQIRLLCFIFQMFFIKIQICLNFI